MPWMVKGQDCREWLVKEYPVVSTGPATLQDTVVTQAIRTLGKKTSREKDYVELWMYQDENRVVQLYLGRIPKFRDRDRNRVVGMQFSNGSYFRAQGESRYLLPHTAYLEYNYLIQPLTKAMMEHLRDHLLLSVEIEIRTRLEPEVHYYAISEEGARGLRQSLRCMLDDRRPSKGESELETD